MHAILREHHHISLTIYITKYEEHTYQAELGEEQGDNSLAYTRHWMSLASFVAREKGLTGTSPIVKFWCPNKLSTAMADYLDEAPRLSVFENVLSAYDAIPQQTLKADIPIPVRKSLVTGCIPLFPVSRGISALMEVQIQGPRRSVR